MHANQSLKWKIQLWYALILGFVLCVLGGGFYFYERAHRLDEIDDQLDKLIHPIMGPLTNHERENPPGRGDRQRRGPPRHEGDPGSDRQGSPKEHGSGPNQEDRNLPGEWSPRASSVDMVGDPDRGQSDLPIQHFRFERNMVPLGFYARAERRDEQDTAFQSSNFPNMEMPENVGRGFFVRFRDERFREIFHQNDHFRVLIGANLEVYYDELNRLKGQIIAGALGLFVIGVLVGYVFVSRAIRPLAEIEKSATRIAQGKLSERIPELPRSGARELKMLAENLNHTFSQLEESFARQVRFTADASHELRTPLTALLAQIEHGLKKPRPGEEYSKILEVCKRSSTRIRKITEQLIELSRYDAGQVQMEFEIVSLSPMLISLAEELKAYVEEEGHTFTTEIVDGEISCDPFRLEQVITNLINNAIQHNERPITITLLAAMKGDECHIEVSDTGKGIQPENLSKLFNRFFQESSSRTKENGRTNVGLGLAISEAIIKAHDGRIETESSPNVKTTFRIVLPRTRQTDLDLPG